MRMEFFADFTDCILNRAAPDFPFGDFRRASIDCIMPSGFSVGVGKTVPKGDQLVLGDRREPFWKWYRTKHSFSRNAHAR